MSHDPLTTSTKIAIGILAALTAIIVTLALILTLGRGRTVPPPSVIASVTVPVSTGSVSTGSTGDTPTSPVSTSSTNEDVPKADPLTIGIPVLGVQANIHLYTEAMAQASKDPLTSQPCWADGRITCVNPPSYKDVYWLKAGVGQIPFGDQPGTNTTGTVYLIGHASATKPAIFTNLYKLTTGNDITVTTANGALHYAVQQVVVLDKNDWSTSTYANEQIPGRLILGTCYHGADAHIGSSGSSKENVIIVAQLSSAEAAG